MAKKQKEDETVRYAWLKDPERTVCGLETFEKAQELRKELEGKLNIESGDVRLRVAYRNRTGKFDVLVKVKTAVKSEPKQQTQEA